MTENSFNSEILSVGLRRLSPEVHYLKASDKFSIGISDYLIWYAGSSIALESKFIREFPGPNVKLLGHEFKGSQITFLESVSLAGSKGYGCVGVGEEKRIYVFRWTQIPSDGNWKTSQFRSRQYKSFGFNEVWEMVRWMHEEQG